MNTHKHHTCHKVRVQYMSTVNTGVTIGSVSWESASSPYLPLASVTVPATQGWERETERSSVLKSPEDTYLPLAERMSACIRRPEFETCTTLLICLGG